MLKENATATSIGQEGVFNIVEPSLGNVYTNQANFTGTAPDGVTDGSTVYAILPVPTTEEVGSEWSTTALPRSLANQTQDMSDGKLTPGSILSASATYATEDTKFSFKHQTSMLRLILAFYDPVQITKITLVADNLWNKIRLNSEEGEWITPDNNYDEQGRITLTVNNQKEQKEHSLYMTVFPGLEMKNMRLIVETDGSGSFITNGANKEISTGNVIGELLRSPSNTVYAGGYLGYYLWI